MNSVIGFCMKKFFQLVILALFSSVVFAKTGVVFVHGKGVANLSDPVAAWDYWGMEFLGNATKEFSLPFLVAHYDGRLSMFDAAKEISKQLVEFIQKEKIDRLVVNTHSFGGVVVRYILSNTVESQDYQAITRVTAWVNTIAAPQLGSETSDLLDTLENSSLTNWFIEWLAQDSASTHNTRTTDMAYYNEHFLFGTAGRPALPVPFYNIAGNGIWNDFYYTLHPEDAGLALVSTLTGFSDLNDGVVPVKSAQAVGVKWFETDANHHHSRRDDYVTLGKTLAADI